jgi:hypothetical protein
MAEAGGRAVPPRAMVAAAFSVLRGVQALLDRLTPAPLAVLDKAFGVTRTAAIGVAARLRIADLLVERPLTAAELAETLSVDADALHRTLRMLASCNIFELRADGRFANNRLSEPLRSDSPVSVRNFAAYCGSPANLRAYSDLEATVHTGKNAFERVHGMSVWDWFGKHPEEGQTFAHAMQDATTLDAPAIARGFAFGELTRLCDVAGGRGTLLAEILLRHPRLKGTLFDERYVLDEADVLLRGRGVHDRVELVAGSFFESIPGGGPTGPDGYLLKDILHDWDDDRSRKILANVRRAARQGTRLFLVETVLESTETAHPKPMFDLHMMMVCVEGRQRSRAEFDRLLGDTGFRLDDVVGLAALQSLVVATAV